MRTLVTTWLAIVMLVLAPALGAQNSGESSATAKAISTILSTEFQHFENPAILLDLSSITSPSVRAQVAAELDRPLVLLSDVKVCAEVTGQAPSCMLKGGDLVAATRSFTRSGPEATVEVLVHGDASGSVRQIVWMSHYRVHLSLDQGNWSVDSIELIRQS